MRKLWGKTPYYLPNKVFTYFSNFQMHRTETPEFIFFEFGVFGKVRLKKIIDHKVIKEIHT